MNPDRNPQHNFPDGKPEVEQPKWRKDFPIEVGADEYGARRDFTKFMVLTSLAFVCGQVWIGFQSLFRRREQEPRKIADVADLAVGESLLFHYPSERDPCLLMRTAPETFVAFSNQCTHLMCPVSPDLAQDRLHCPCHEGYFQASTGKPLAGPPRRPLPRIVLRIENGEIIATDVQRRNS
ncbi:QcrA and Rieske domain-containing protein [Roseimaritima sediminicola]|uniref:QcrA and Rieske domain-containing protein n=1 Tax=Roseimaritima sediminicola TaxID=2662066 RepID=UPI0012982DF0|nr:Rieske 2Fe-2S domain-containing protein [Roseimaritima sediminicola]